MGWPWTRGRLWRRRLADDWATPLFAHRGVVGVWVNDGNGQLLGLDAATGKERWRVEAQSHLYGTAITAADGDVVVGGGSNRVACHDVESGRTRWSVSTGAQPALAVCREGWATSEAAVCVDPATGEERWRGPHPEVDGFFVENPLDVSAHEGGVVLFTARYLDRIPYDREPAPASAYRAHAVDPASGAVLWVHDRPPRCGLVFATSEGIELRAAADGAVRWRAPAAIAMWGTTVLAGGNAVVTVKHGLSAFDLATGTEAWRLDEPAPDPEPDAIPQFPPRLTPGWDLSAAGEGHVLVSDVNGRRVDVRLLDAADGREVGRAPVPAKSHTVSDGRLLFTSVSRNVIAAAEPA